MTVFTLLGIPGEGFCLEIYGRRDMRIPSPLALMERAAKVAVPQTPISILIVKQIDYQRARPGSATHAAKPLARPSEVVFEERNDSDHWRLCSRTVGPKGYVFVSGSSAVCWWEGSTTYQRYDPEVVGLDRGLHDFLDWLDEGLKKPKIRDHLARGMVTPFSFEGRPAYRVSWKRPPLMDLEAIRIGDVTTRVVLDVGTGRILKIVWGDTPGDLPPRPGSIGDNSWTMYYRDRDHPYMPETFVFSKADILAEVDPLSTIFGIPRMESTMLNR